MVALASKLNSETLDVDDMGLLKPIISPHAKRDLNDIWYYIAEDSIRYADEVIDELVESINALNERPGMGRKRTEFSGDESLSFCPV